MKALDNNEKMVWLHTLLDGMYQDARVECECMRKEFNPDEYVWYMNPDICDFLEHSLFGIEYPYRIGTLTAFNIRVHRVYAQKGIVLMRVVSKHEEDLTWI